MKADSLHTNTFLINQNDENCVTVNLLLMCLALYKHKMSDTDRTSVQYMLPLSLTVICNLKVLVRAVHWLFPDFAFMWLVEEAKKNMPLELDFLNEGHNAERVALMLAHFPFLKVHILMTLLSAFHNSSMSFIMGCSFCYVDLTSSHALINSC